MCLSFDLTVEADGTSGEQSVSGVEILVVGCTLDQKLSSPCSSSEEHLVCKEHPPVIELNAGAVAFGIEGQRSHFALDELDAEINSSLNHITERFVCLGEAHIGVVENSVDSFDVCGGKRAVPVLTDFILSQEAGIVIDALGLIGG